MKENNITIFHLRTMFQYGFLLFGTYLTLLPHVHSYVLLTANIGDLKRIAQKYIPQAVVENIADIIYKASEDLAATNVSEENEENSYNHKKKYSMQKESESESSKDIDDAKSLSDEVATESSILSMDSILQAISSQGFKNKATNGKKPKLNNDDVDSYPEKVESKKPYHRKKTKSPKVLNKKTPNDESKLSEELANKDSKSFTSSIDLFSDQKNSYNKQPEFNSDEESQSDIAVKTEPKRSKSKGKKVKTKSKHSYKSNLKLDRVRPKRKHSKNDDSEDNSYKDDTVTTRIERNEFDQYVNLNYPKSELVATSGLLALKKAPNTQMVRSRGQEHHEEEVDDQRRLHGEDFPYDCHS
ncbi:uncharacterized G-patch domain protein DDB_G0278987-like [Maniola hyperantus]|uniref:uncharacterized G-patch domain protein DDB_G0278987-like n=1 Tax=Aphantopus hyperantus TaxID=2795564 RepID=UPI003748DDE0